MSTRHVQKIYFFSNPYGLLTFICILVPRTIFNLIFWWKKVLKVAILFYKGECLKYNGKLAVCILQLLRQKMIYKRNLKPLAVIQSSQWFFRHPHLISVICHLSLLKYDIILNICHMAVMTYEICRQIYVNMGVFGSIETWGIQPIA